MTGSGAPAQVQLPGAGVTVTGPPPWERGQHLAASGSASGAPRDGWPPGSELPIDKYRPKKDQVKVENSAPLDQGQLPSHVWGER